jgi:large subunit ribosomal protein L24
LAKSAPLQRRTLRAHLAKELRTKYSTRSVRVRKGDTVKVLRGEYSGVEAKVTTVDPRSGRLSIEGVTREKIAGGTAPIRIHASKVFVTALNLDDPWRKKTLEGKQEA